MNRYARYAITVKVSIDPIGVVTHRLTTTIIEGGIMQIDSDIQKAEEWCTS